MSKKFYGVQKGRAPGVYTSWAACQAQVTGYPGAKYKAFPSRQEAEAFVRGTSSRLAPFSLADNPELQTATSPAVEIWVDGACLQHAQGGMRFGWAYLIVQNGKEVHRASGHDVPSGARIHRNVAGEITAVLKALAWCHQHGITSATVYHDYQGLAAWAQGSWKAKTPFTQAYVQAVRKSGIQLSWRKIQAHTGIKYNEIVDDLARTAAQGQKTT
ncbi:MAG: hypothetical protein D6704_09105 [Nitrospirae bacterium]|nr:MAG: hypothetical protein D6704_09105 [Nitrospirota bacterium]